MNELARLPSLAQTIASHGLSAKKSLGQHFLLDLSVTADVARAAAPLKGFHVIEIGPGPGGLTRALLESDAEKIHVVEKDARCLAIMESLQACMPGRLEIILADALDIDLTASVPAPRKIVANLPYNAGTAMLLGWLDAIYQQGQGAFASLTLMFQKEVADRIMATPGGRDYGRLSVISQFLCEVRHEFDLPPSAFSPPPKVTSSVITMTPREKPLAEVDKETLEKIVARAFGQRRKMLRQSLKGLAIPADDLLKKAGIEPTLRAEQLSVADFCNLADACSPLRK